MTQEKIVGMQFTDTAYWNPAINEGLGAFQARFVVVHEGREQEAESLVRAFKSAGGKGTKVRDGVVAMTESQLQDRIVQLNGLPGRETIVGELDRGLQHLQRLEAHRHAPQETAPQAKAKTLTA